MSERLTTRLANGGVGYDNGEYFKVCYPWNEHCLTDIDRMAIRLCDLEDKIEQGKIVELPCRVGQVVYEVQPMRARTQGYKITTVLWNGHYWWFTWVLKGRNGIYGNIDGFSSHQIGKTVFLDRAAAEAKLKGADK
jgi:hypothetical protein